jgi:8-oxo-dGTP diphosphatase
MVAHVPAQSAKRPPSIAHRPDDVCCVLLGTEAEGTASRETWCGRVAPFHEFVFLNPTHAALNNRQGQRLLPCAWCAQAIASTLVEPDRRPKVGTGVFVRRPDGAILMGLRTSSHGAGTWHLPGGHIEADETAEQAAVRELLEETGIASVGRVRLLRGPARLRSFDKPCGPQAYVTLFLLVDVAADVEPQVLEPEKCSEWRWIETDDTSVLPGPIFGCLADLFEDARIHTARNLRVWLNGAGR